MIHLGRLKLEVSYWRAPLLTRHHDYPNGRPLPGRRFDWQHVRCMSFDQCVTPHPWRHLWLYTRDKAGVVRGRLIAWAWVARR